MKILVIGDVTSPGGIAHLKTNLWKKRAELNVDLCIVNGENAAFVTGISPELAEELLRGGADVITGGNHTLQNKAAYTMLDECSTMLRPINFGDGAPGHGYTLVDAAGYRVLVINAMGNVHIEPTLDLPFSYIDRVLKAEEGNYDLSVLDIHAEATGEKLAVGYAYDGKINVVFGTHTHVQTADEKILPKGTGYISDVGMCGEDDGILGMDAATIVERMKSRLPIRYKAAEGTPVADGVIFTVDVSNKRVTHIERIRF